MMILLLVIAVHLYLLSRLVFFPYPELFIYPYLTNQGLLPYKQILDQHFPGLLFFPINLATLGMTTPQVARYWQYGLVILTHLLLFIVARKIFKSERLALLTNFLYLLWQPFFEGYVLWIDSFLPPLLLLVFYFIHLWQKEDKERYLFVSGLFLGVSLLFKQVVAPLIVLVSIFTYSQTKKTKSVATLLVGVLIPVAFLISYIVRLGIWQDFYFWTVTFNLTTFSQMGRKYPDFLSLAGTLPVFGLAVVSWFIHYPKTKSRKLAWLAIFLLASLTFSFARFDYVHLQPALPFALLILIYTLLRISKRSRSKVYLGFVILSFVLLAPFFKTNMGDKIFFFGKLEKVVSIKVNELTKPGDKIFALATMPHIYQMTKTLPPGEIFVFQFPWFMLEAQEKILSGIMDDPPQVVIRDRQATTGGMLLISYMEDINHFIEKNYQVIEIFDGIEILVRK